MPIEVLYFADLKDVTGISRESLNSENKNINELIKLLFFKYQPLKEILWDDIRQNLKQNVSIAINDNIIHRKNILSIKLSNGDRIAFLLPASGG